MISLKIDLISEPYDAYIDTTSSRFLQSKESSLSSSFNSNINHNLESTVGRGRRKPGILENQFVSPSNGTDILYRPIQLIKCENQTKCIQPELQLIKKFKVYYCK